MPLTKTSITGISLDAAGLVALADLNTISTRTALKGSASFLDVLFLAPGIHTQQDADKVSGGELPATGAMTSGYVFRIENQATVYYLQKISEPGHLVVVEVKPMTTHATKLDMFTSPNVLYGLGIALTISAIVVLGFIHDYWAIGVLLMLVIARFLNMVVIKRRTEIGWKGAPEPGVKGDLLVLLSNDRWVRVKGMVDDLKAVTSGQWLRDPTTIEGYAGALATLLVYAGAAVASNASTTGSLVMLIVLLVSVALLGLCNSLTLDLQMSGCRVGIINKPKKYGRRLDMAKELIEETGRNDWAITMGLILPPSGSAPVNLTM